MYTSSRSYPGRGLALLLLSVLASACVDVPTMPSPQDPATVAVPALQCNVNVQAETLTCTAPDPARLNHAIAANRIVGGQDVNVKLSGSGISYDAGTEIFSLNVTVQNLMRQAIGTPDGSTVQGVRIFFAQGPTAYPGGTVTVANPSGTAFFTEPDQTYFEYAQILQPYEISSPLTWMFNMPAGVAGFTFVVYVSAPMPNEMLTLLDRVWTGAADNAWLNTGNWRDGLVPDSASAVSVPPDSLLAGSSTPTLSADAQLTHLRVGGGSVLNLGGYTLTAWGNVDAPGTISGGVLRLGGPTSLLRGQVPSLIVNAATELQGSTVASGAVSIAGSMTILGSTPLTISIP
jgi:hypothetical protein